jgi:hypothetical protein
MSFVGNLIFTPILTLFLVISSLLFFTELLGIPNQTLATILNFITNVWDRILHLGSSKWLVECAKPHIAILFAIPVVTFIVLFNKKINTHTKRLCAMGILTIATFGIFGIQKQYNHHGSLTRSFGEKLYVIKLVKSNSIIVIDDGFFSRKKSIDKAMSYEFKPWIVKHFGNIHIKEFRLKKISVGGLQAALYACTQWHVDAVWLPFFRNTLSKFGWKTYFDLKRCATEKGIRFVRY